MKRESNPAMAQVGRVEEKNDWRNCPDTWSNQPAETCGLNFNFQCNFPAVTEGMPSRRSQGVSEATMSDLSRRTFFSQANR